MPQNEHRSRHTSDREILAYPAGQDAIKSVVVQASAIPTQASAVFGQVGVKALLAGTILEKVPSDAQGRVRKYTNGTIVGILGTTLVFAGEGQNFDAPADAVFNGAVFRKDRIVGYNDSGTATALHSALFNCQFV